MDPDQEISVEQFVQAVTDQKSQDKEAAQLASQIIDSWIKQENSIHPSLDIITTSYDQNLRFFAIACIQHNVRQKYEELGEDLIYYIIEVSKQQIIGNQAIISRNDMIKLLVLYSDICCIDPSQIAIIEELERKVQLIFTRILFEESREQFIHSYGKAPIQEEMSNLHGFVRSLLSDFELTHEYSELLCIASFEYIDEDLFQIFLEHFVDFLSNASFHKYLNQFIENMCTKIDDESLNPLLIETFQLYCNSITPETEYFCESYAKQNATLVYSCIFGYTEIFFLDNFDFAISIINNFFENIPSYASNEPQFYYALGNIKTILISLVDGTSPFVEYFNPFIELISNMLSEDPSLINDEFAKILSDIQNQNYNPSIVQYYEERIETPTVGLCYTASFVMWWDQRLDLFEQLLSNIFNMDEIPSTALKLVQRAIFFQLSDEILEAFLTLGLSSFDTDPEGASLFIKVLSANKPDKCIPYLPDIIDIIRPKFEEYSFKQMFNSIVAILFLASKCTEPDDTQALAEDMGQIILGYFAAALEEGISSVEDALKSIGSIIRTTTETTSNQVLKEYYGALGAELITHLIELAEQLTDDISEDHISQIHSLISEVFQSLIASKWITDENKQVLIAYTIESLKTHPVHDHFRLLAEIGLPTLEYSEIAEIINSIDINDDVDLTCSSLQYLTEIARKNIESFYSVYPDPMLVLRFLDSYSQRIQSSALETLQQLLKSKHIPEGFPELVVDTVISNLERFDNCGKKTSMDILTSSNIPHEDMYHIIINITGQDENSFAARKIREEFSKPSPNKKIIEKYLKDLISKYACDNQIQQERTSTEANDDDLL